MYISYLNIYLSQKCQSWVLLLPKLLYVNMIFSYFALKGNPPEAHMRSGEQVLLPEHILPKWCIHKHFKGTLTKILMKRIHCDGKTVRNLVIKRWYSFKCNLPIIQQEWWSHHPAGLVPWLTFPAVLMLEPGVASGQSSSEHVILSPTLPYPCGYRHLF